MKYRYKILFIIISTAVYILGMSYILNEGENIKATLPEVKSDMRNIETKKVYLTFDDGPSSLITPKILGVLKENNVKATFFVVGSQIKDRENVLKQIHNEGHSIGLHTFSHKYRTIYKSKDTFLNEMKITAEEINKVIGISPKIIRFPGGSKKHLDKDFYNEIHALGYKIYDWNISAADGFNNNISADKIYRNSIDREEKFNRLIITLHCAAENNETVKALPSIIKHYRDEGFIFAVINEDTPEYYFRYKIIN